MWSYMPIAYAGALEVLRRGVDVDLHQVLSAALEPLGGSDPVVYLVEDNGYAISVPVEVNTAGGSISDMVFLPAEPVAVA